MLLDYHYMDQGWMLFEEAEMCAFQMKLGTHKMIVRTIRASSKT